MSIKGTLRKAKMRLAAIATIVIAVALPAVLFTGTASADTWCNYNGGTDYCMQTNGGHVYACQDSNPNNGGNCAAFADEFELQAAGGGFAQLLSDGSGGCIGDYGNSSSNASAGLDSCPASGNAGWGTKFTYNSCSNGLGAGFYFVNYHWNGWMGPQSYTNNANEYLNKPGAYCFADLQ